MNHAVVKSKLLAAQQCHPNAVQTLIEEAIRALDGIGDSPVAMTADDYAELMTLRAAANGPDGFETWKEAALHERVRRTKAEGDLARFRSEGLIFPITVLLNVAAFGSNPLYADGTETPNRLMQIEAAKFLHSLQGTTDFAEDHAVLLAQIESHPLYGREKDPAVVCADAGAVSSVGNELDDLPKIQVVFETVDPRPYGATGLTSACVKRVERQDDGSLSVVIDHWPGMLVNGKGGAL